MKRKLTYEERVRWFIQNYYETGMEYGILLDSLKNEDLDNFKWYDDIIKFPKYIDEIERILCAAVWYKELPLIKPEVLRLRGYSPYNVDKGIVFCGWRHGNCIYQMVTLTGKRSVTPEVGEYEQGFLTSLNRFVDRKEGGEIAFKSGQTDELKTTLFSEDLY